MANSFANFNEPYINGSTLKRLYSSVVKENIFQDIFVKDGEGCQEKYCEDTTVAQVTVLRILPGNQFPRSMSGTSNNGFFNADSPLINETTAYPIDILDLVDYMTDIPEVQQDMMSTDLAANRAKILGGQVATAVNAITIAAQLCKNFNDVYNEVIEDNKIALGASPSTGDYLKAVVDASAKLDDGDPENGVNTFPIESRALYIRSSFKAKLMAEGQLIVGGSNYAQQMIADGGLAPGAKSNNTTGYCGKILDIPTYMAGGNVWNMVEGYLGLAKGALANLHGVMVSSYGTGRGLSFNASIKQIDSPAGAGIRMQPLYRFGADCWEALSVVPIVANGWSNPSTGSLSVMAPGSRVSTISFNAGTGASGTVPADITARYGTQITLPDSTGLTGGAQTTNFDFWGVAANSTAGYEAGSKYTVDISKTLYAVWKA